MEPIFQHLKKKKKHFNKLEMAAFVRSFLHSFIVASIYFIITGRKSCMFINRLEDSTDCCTQKSGGNKFTEVSFMAWKTQLKEIKLFFSSPPFCKSSISHLKKKPKKNPSVELSSVLLSVSTQSSEFTVKW